MLDAADVMELLGLRPHPAEGGYFVETYRSDETLPMEYLPERYAGPRALSTAIYYLLTPESFSAIHRLGSDEIFHFYLGDPVEMVQLYPDGSAEGFVLGTDLATMMRPQVVVPGGVWQGLRLVPGGRYALLGTTVAPGFDFADFEIGDRSALVAAYPDFEEMIIALTREA